MSIRVKQYRYWQHLGLIGLCVIATLGVPNKADAGFFGPDTAQECIRDNAGDAATAKLAREIAKACRIEFAATALPWQRSRARCQRKKLSKADSNKEVALIRRQCIVDNPISSG